jgi:hypothetical protein
MERFLSRGKLIDLLDSMMNIEDPADGFYMLYAPKDSINLPPDTECFIFLCLYDVEDDFEIPMALEAGVEPAIEVNMIKRITQIAYSQKSDLSKDDIVNAINYYLDNDAFLNFKS